MNKSEKPIFLVIILGILLRFIMGFLVTPAGDGCWHSNVARFIARNGSFPLFENLGREAFARPPLYHLIASFFYRVFDLFGYGEFGLKLISPLFGSLILVFTYLLVSKLFNDKRIVFWSVFFVSFVPLHMYHSSIPFIDMVVSFFVILTIFFLINKKYVLAGISFGLAMLSKYSGAFLFLVILFYLFRSLKPKEFLKKSLLIAVIGFIISFPWYLRNWILLGNPVWPLLRNIFGGVYAEVFYAIKSNPGIVNLINPNLLFRTYLEFFGVPQGNFQNLFFINIPFLNLMLLLWFIGTLVFIVPFIVGLFKINYKKKKIQYLLVWTGTFIFVFLLFTLFSSSYVRILLPCIPAIAVIWAIGLNKIKIKNLGSIYLLFVLFCAIGFVSVEFVKANVASNAWHSYDKDFSWIKSNTSSDSVIFARGQCFSYYLDRQVYFGHYNASLYYGFNDSLAYRENISYILVNQQFDIMPKSTLPEDIISIFEENSKYAIVYENKDTGTKIYKVNQ